MILFMLFTGIVPEVLPLVSKITQNINFLADLVKTHTTHMPPLLYATLKPFCALPQPNEYKINMQRNTIYSMAFSRFNE